MVITAVIQAQQVIELVANQDPPATLGTESACQRAAALKTFYQDMMKKTVTGFRENHALILEKESPARLSLSRPECGHWVAPLRRPAAGALSLHMTGIMTVAGTSTRLWVANTKNLAEEPQTTTLRRRVSDRWAGTKIRVTHQTCICLLPTTTLGALTMVLRHRIINAVTVMTMVVVIGGEVCCGRRPTRILQITTLEGVGMRNHCTWSRDWRYLQKTTAMTLAEGRYTTGGGGGTRTTGHLMDSEAAPSLTRSRMKRIVPVVEGMEGILGASTRPRDYFGEGDKLPSA